MRGEFHKDGREEEFKYLAQQLSVLSQSILALQENKDEITERKPCISPSEMI
jgi:prefoldin subunit 5